MSAAVRLAVLCDLLEERWFSMDLLGDMLIEEGARLPGVAIERVRPALPRALSPFAHAVRATPLERWGYRASIGFGRFVQYPLAVLKERARHDCFHVTDHSYGHVLLELPAAQSGVFCHDLDAYRPLFDAPRASAPRRALAHALLAGLKRANVVFHSSRSVRDEMLERRLVPAERLVHAPYGVASEFQPEARSEDLALAGRPPFVMHVGSLIPRKNPEFLLALFIALGRADPELELFQMGASFSDAQRAELKAAGVFDRVHQFPHMKRPELSAYFRATRAVLLPSLAEGFGLPVVEALACGAPVVVSDIPVLKEVGGEGVVVRPTSSLEDWRTTVLAVVRGAGPARAERLRAASRYTWAAHARTIVETYVELARRR